MLCKACLPLAEPRKRFFSKQMAGAALPERPSVSEDVGHCRKRVLKGFLQKIWHTDPKIRHTNPSFMPYEPFLLGVGVVFNLLTMGQKPAEKSARFSDVSHSELGSSP